MSSGAYPGSRSHTPGAAGLALAARYDMSFAAVQKHVAVLERAALVVKRRRGREQIVHGNPDTLRKAARLFDAYEASWRHRVAAIDTLVSDDRS
ncbi:helix-turn-helix domain-containing protein [Saccharomonospora xinjiangensis]|uniref:Transcriptional regulator n=1 Tax=Saccharomonospora xinjiangensis XJ-54 TaxID=882086 RepID=I0UWQ9_9PSEU|nr:helix-turn-helix domain-containing protein [Saccharomonospora xinjiangensis]EID52312.1 hypothetical protein SacxiDRAFT_0023 [Saccharomonospora xinjiangensis XJ-54]